MSGLRKFLVLSLLLLFPGLLLGQAPDPREDGTPVPTYWNTGMTPAALGAQLSLGWRITDLEIESTNPWSFTVALVPNSGVHQIGWWWYYGIDGAGITTQLQQNNARLIDLEPYDNGAGATRFACVMVSNTGVNAKGWNWLYNATSAQVNSLVAQGKRLVDLEQYTLGSQTYYACVTINNSGADQRAWWYYYGVSSATVTSLLTQNNAMVYDLDRVGSSYNIVMISTAGRPKRWHYFGLTGTQVTDRLGQIGARLTDVNQYYTLLGWRYDVAFINNSNALSTRLSEILRNNTDGDSGVFLKRANGSELAYINGDRVHEPAGTLKTLHLLEAMARVVSGPVTLSDLYRTYTDGGSNSCPVVTGTNVYETLTSILTQMMKFSDNTRTRTITENFGNNGGVPFAGLNMRAQVLGMTSTSVNHHIGCGTPANTTTLRDISRLHEQVINGYLGASRSAFYSHMLNDYEFSGFAYGQLGTVMHEEIALAGLQGEQTAAFKDRFEIRYMPGIYALGGLYYRCWGAYVKIPFVINGQVVNREYTLGSYVAHATTQAQAIAAAQLAAAEALRDELAAALATWATVAVSSSIPIGLGCGGVSNTNWPRPGLGTQAGFVLGNGFPNSPALFCVGFSSTSANGLALPTSLVPYGSAPGCMAYNDAAGVILYFTSPIGDATHHMAIPFSLSLAGTTFYSQWYCIDGSGTLPFQTSHSIRSVIGL